MKLRRAVGDLDAPGAVAVKTVIGDGEFRKLQPRNPKPTRDLVQREADALPNPRIDDPAQERLELRGACTAVRRQRLHAERPGRLISRATQHPAKAPLRRGPERRQKGLPRVDARDEHEQPVKACDRRVRQALDDSDELPAKNIGRNCLQQHVGSSTPTLPRSVPEQLCVLHELLPCAVRRERARDRVV